jgi:hypothetical protein
VVALVSLARLAPPVPLVLLVPQDLLAKQP